MGVEVYKGKILKFTFETSYNTDGRFESFNVSSKIEMRSSPPLL